MTKETGYYNYKTGEFVPDDVSYDYALERCLNGTDHEEFREMLSEWYFSGGNWERKN